MGDPRVEVRDASHGRTQSQGTPVTFFYADDCPYCEPTLLAVADVLEGSGTRLYVRKPTQAELRTPGFAFPAAVVPVGVFGVRKTTLVTGTGIPDALRELLKAEDGE